MQAREKQLAELKTTFVESKTGEEHYLLVTKLATELDRKSSIAPIWIQKLPPELIMQLPPELVTIIFLYAREYYFSNIDSSIKNIFNAKDMKGGLYIDEIEKLRKAVESTLSTIHQPSIFKLQYKDIKELGRKECDARTGGYIYPYIVYSRMEDNDKSTVINIHGYYMNHFTQTIVFSKPIKLRIKEQKDDLVIEHEQPYAFAEAIFINSERYDQLSAFSLPEPLGAPYQYFIGDKKSKSDVTQELQDCHRLFAHKTTVKPPHQPLPSLTSSRIFCRDQVGENSELDKTHCHLASSTEGEKSTLNQKKNA